MGLAARHATRLQPAGDYALNIVRPPARLRREVVLGDVLTPMGANGGPVALLSIRRRSGARAAPPAPSMPLIHPRAASSNLRQSSAAPLEPERLARRVHERVVGAQPPVRAQPAHEPSQRSSVNASMPPSRGWRASVECTPQAGGKYGAARLRSHSIIAIDYAITQTIAHVSGPVAGGLAGQLSYEASFGPASI